MQAKVKPGNNLKQSFRDTSERCFFSKILINKELEKYDHISKAKENKHERIIISVLLFWFLALFLGTIRLKRRAEEEAGGRGGSEGAREIKYNLYVCMAVILRKCILTNFSQIINK